MSSPGGHGASSDDELDPDEPHTPLWLPLVGLCLFVAFLIYILVGQKQAPAADRPAAAPSASVAAQPGQPAPQPGQPAPQPGQPAPQPGQPAPQH